MPSYLSPQFKYMIFHIFICIKRTVESTLKLTLLEALPLNFTMNKKMCRIAKLVQNVHQHNVYFHLAAHKELTLSMVMKCLNWHYIYFQAFSRSDYYSIVKTNKAHSIKQLKVFPNFYENSYRNKYWEGKWKKKSWNVFNLPSRKQDVLSGESFC